MDDRDTKSIHSGMTYNQSAIGEMNQAELDKLLAMKEKRIRDIRDRYLESSATIPTYHQRLNEEKEAFTTKQRYKDNSLAYPTFGRGLLPDREMNTFMI
jgi:molecular chaperone GrpE (heat shock protein)